MEECQMHRIAEHSKDRNKANPEYSSSHLIDKREVRRLVEDSGIEWTIS